MGDDGIPLGYAMGHKVIVGSLKEGVHRSRLIPTSRGPGGNLPGGREKVYVRPKEEPASPVGGPFTESILYAFKFIFNSFNTEDYACLVRREEPIPKTRAKIQSIVQVLGLNEHVGVKKVRNQIGTPRLLPSSWKVLSLEKPRSRKASLWRVRPSRVLMTNAWAKSFPVLAVWVR